MKTRINVFLMAIYLSTFAHASKSDFEAFEKNVELSSCEDEKVQALAASDFVQTIQNKKIILLGESHQNKFYKTHPRSPLLDLIRCSHKSVVLIDETLVTIPAQDELNQLFLAGKISLNTFCAKATDFCLLPQNRNLLRWARHNRVEFFGSGLNTWQISYLRKYSKNWELAKKLLFKEVGFIVADKYLPIQWRDDHIAKHIKNVLMKYPDSTLIFSGGAAHLATLASRLQKYPLVLVFQDGTGLSYEGFQGQKDLSLTEELFSKTKLRNLDVFTVSFDNSSSIFSNLKPLTDGFLFGESWKTLVSKGRIKPLETVLSEAERNCVSEINEDCALTRSIFGDF